VLQWRKGISLSDSSSTKLLPSKIYPGGDHVDEKDMLDFEKSPYSAIVPSYRFRFLKFVGSSVSQARITAPGVSKSELAVLLAHFYHWKRINHALILELKRNYLRINPPDSYLGTSLYKKEMQQF
jgi:hypothetical protein